ncbi:MAG: hypothetical protein V1913_04320 [Fibrobacterota bacterium]
MNKKASCPALLKPGFFGPLLFSVFILFSSSLHAGKTNSARVTALYKEMIAFKGQPEFHKNGFDTCCVYYQWIKKARSLRVDHTLTFHESFATASVIALAKEYVITKGKENGNTKTARNDYVSALAWQMKLDMEKKGK